MDSITNRRVKDLPVSVRKAIEELLGRPLEDGEQVSVTVLKSHPAPQGSDRDAAGDRLKAVLESMAQKSKPISAEEFEDAVEEAMNHVRPRPR